tara:strand:+ start:191 stop:439 length:249 start_codon:yes stop_codon:yes gene_type:complete
MAIFQLVVLYTSDVNSCYSLENFGIFALGEVIEVSTNQYGLSLFSGMISLIALGIYTLLTFDTGNDDDDSDSGSGGLMQPVN